MTLRWLPWLALSFVPACSSTSDDSSGARDAASEAPRSGDAATTDASDAASDGPGTCNTLGDAAPVIPVEQVASDPPAAQGGTIVDGTYWLTAAVIYTGPAGPTGASGTGQTTLQIAGGTIQVATSSSPSTRTVSFTTSGTSITSVDTCPDTDTRTDAYTATPTTLVVELDGGTDDAGARTVVETFTKQ